MVVCYRIKVLEYVILMKRMSPEMQRATNEIIFHVHNSELCMKDVDITKQGERRFYLDTFPGAVDLVKESMVIKAYKKHHTGALVTLGTTREDISDSVAVAIEREPAFTMIPGVFYLKNGTGKFVAKLECDIELWVKNQQLSDYYDLLAIEEELEFPNPFVDDDSEPAKPDSKKDKNEAKNKKRYLLS